jgi:hypothetical protein
VRQVTATWETLVFSVPRAHPAGGDEGAADRFDGEEFLPPSSIPSPAVVFGRSTRHGSLPPAFGVLFMHRLMLLIAIVTSLVVASTASANQARPARPEVSGRQGPVSKLIELERRKNEWLRQKFAR